MKLFNIFTLYFISSIYRTTYFLYPYEFIRVFPEFILARPDLKKKRYNIL